MTEITGKVALVTGGGSGIGLGLTRALGREGCPVIVVDILQQRAEDAAAQIVAAGGRAVGLACDVSSLASVHALKAEAESAFGEVSLLFSNAGATHCEPLVEMSDQNVEWLLAVNLQGAFNMVRTFLPAMLARGDGHIVTTASSAAVIPTMLPYFVPYTAAKAGVIGMMLNLRAELRGSGVGCSVLCPGGVATGMAGSPGYRPERFGGASNKAVEIRPEMIPNMMLDGIHRREPDEVAEMVLLAVRNDRAIILTDSGQRDHFVKDFVDLMLSAYDDVDAFDAAEGRVHSESG